MIKKIILHGATNFKSSNYGDFLYGELVYEYLKEKGLLVSFYQPSSFFIKHLNGYDREITIKKEEADLIIYLPGGYFGEGHKARYRDNAIQFIRFMPLGIWASFSKIPMIVVGIGAGRNRSVLMNFGIHLICRHSHFITVRDKESYNALKSLYPSGNIIETGDLILTRKLKTINQSCQLLNIEHNRKYRKILLVHYNHSKIALKKFAKPVKRFIKNHKEYFVVVASDSIVEDENELFMEFEKESGVKCIHFLYSNPSEMTTLLKVVDVVLTCKLHVGVVASLFNKSVIAVACHPEKTIRFYSQIGEIGRFVSLFEADDNKIYEMLETYHDKRIQIGKDIIEKANITWDIIDLSLKVLLTDDYKA